MEIVLFQVLKKADYHRFYLIMMITQKHPVNLQKI